MSAVGQESGLDKMIEKVKSVSQSRSACKLCRRLEYRSFDIEWLLSSNNTSISVSACYWHPD